MSRVGKNIYKRKDGRWEGRYIKSHDAGITRYGSVYGHSCREAKEKLFEAIKKSSECSITMSAGSVRIIGKAWLSEIAGELKISSVNKYEDILKLYIYPEFGDCELSGIRNDDIIEFAHKLMKEGGESSKGLSVSSVNQIMSVMNSLRLFALRKNYTVNYITDCVTAKRGNADIRVFSIEEETRLIEYLCKHYDRTALGILLCLFAGLRVGEICALTGDDFDFSSGTLSISKTMQRVRISGNGSKKTEVRILEPKTGCSVRQIPIPENLKKLLCSECKEGTFLLSGDKVQFVEPRTLQNRFRRILLKAGIDKANFHATRHTYATRCIEQGVDIKCLSEMLGHASVSITLNRYVHPSMELKAENLGRLTGRFPIEVE